MTRPLPSSLWLVVELDFKGAADCRPFPGAPVRRGALPTAASAGAADSRGVHAAALR